jgi:hypothetical protein
MSCRYCDGLDQDDECLCDGPVTEDPSEDENEDD